MKFVHAYSTPSPQNATINSTISLSIMIVCKYNAWLSLIFVHIIKVQPTKRLFAQNEQLTKIVRAIDKGSISYRRTILFLLRQLRRL